MLLAVDVGNTNIVLGLFRGEALSRSWRITTDRQRTVDEYAALVHDLFSMAGINFSEMKNVVISSVVPSVLAIFEKLCRDYFQCEPLVVSAEIKNGMKIHYDNPAEVGADRIVNAVAAYEKYQSSIIVIDFGTATTFDCISANGEYLGGTIAPGIGISADALFERASKLPRVDFTPPPRVIARNTVHSIQAGITYGYAGLVDGIVQRMQLESNENFLVVATGGLAPVIAPLTLSIKEVDADLTLKGLRIIHHRSKRN